MTTTIAERVRQKLDASPFTQGELGDAIGLDKSKMSRALNSLPTFSTGELAAIAEKLDVDLYWLISGAPSAHSPRFAYRHVFDPASGAHVRPDANLREQIERILLAYRQAQLPPPNDLLSSFRAACGADAYGPERLPSSFTDVRPVSQQVHQRWRAWLAEGNDPVLDLRAFLGGRSRPCHRGRTGSPAGDDARAPDVRRQRDSRRALRLLVLHPLRDLPRARTPPLRCTLVARRGHRCERSRVREVRQRLRRRRAAEMGRGQERPVAEMSSDQLAEHLWTLGIGLATARARCGTTGAPCPAPEVTQGDIALRWMRDHGTSSRGSA